MSELILPKNNIVLSDDSGISVDYMLEENARRLDVINAPFNPYTGEYSVGERSLVEIEDFPIPQMWLPNDMLDNEFMESLIYKGFNGFIYDTFYGVRNDKRALRHAQNVVLDHFDRLRNRYDFPYWCWMRVPIAMKGGGDDVRFRLNLPQRKYMTTWDDMVKQKRPVRIIVLKARQWGGSTVTQVRFAHTQLVVSLGVNSIIVGHVKDASTEVKDMYFKLINNYPKELLYAPGSEFNAKLPNIHGTSSSANLFYVDSRKCKLKLGTAIQPDSARGGDSTLAHCTEVAMWTETEGKTPEDIVRSVTGGIAYIPQTVIIYESTANSTEGFFHDEYMAAKDAKEHGRDHQFESLFVSWYECGWKNMLPFRDNEKYLKENSPYEKYSPCFDPYLPEVILPNAPTEREFAEKLLSRKRQQTSDTDREEPGAYLWWLWERGASLQAIYWYTIERSKFHEHADIAREAPSDDVEAFKHSGQKVFSDYFVNQFEKMCRPPKYIGEVESTLVVSAEEFKQYQHRANSAFTGRRILSNLSFKPDETGRLKIWEMPEYFDDCKIKNRYITVVDIGGTSNRADFSVIAVFDRYGMLEGERPAIVAQWYGHCDIDLLAWKAAQIAKFYDNSLLVIESNTLETRDKDRDVDGDMSGFILNQIKEAYPNLYERKRDEDQILENAPSKYGYHTNTRTKPMIVAMLKKVIRECGYIERDKGCLDEYKTYVKLPNGSWAAPKGKHDDRLMTRGIGLLICFTEMEPPKVIMTKKQKTITSGNREAGII